MKLPMECLIGVIDQSIVMYGYVDSTIFCEYIMYTQTYAHVYIYVSVCVMNVNESVCVSDLLLLRGACIGLDRC